jgi:tetratricopeptide (TPR) repeat protein
VNLKMGNFDQAISDFKAAKSLGGGRQEPWATYELIRAQNYSGRYEEALESLNHLQGSITQDALPASVPWLRILSYSGLGQVEEARKIWDRVIGYFPDLDDGYLAGWLPLIGEAEEGRRLLDALEQRWQTGMDCSQIDCRFPYAGSYHLGDLDQTFVWLHRVLDANDLRIIERVYAVEFESLRADPRFEEIRRRIDAATIHFPEADRNSSLEGS